MLCGRHARDFGRIEVCTAPFAFVSRKHQQWNIAGPDLETWSPRSYEHFTGLRRVANDQAGENHAKEWPSRSFFVGVLQLLLAAGTRRDEEGTEVKCILTQQQRG
jgi:hypothetical protein